MIILIDNYDSFTYNLYQMFGEINPDIEVIRNDRLTVGEVLAKRPSHIVISPGPGFPAKAGISTELIRKAGNTPVLGVCLGHQAIGEAFGGTVSHAGRPVHGKATKVKLNRDCRLFRDMPEEIMAGRYHSLIVANENLPEQLSITAVSDNGEIMGLSHISCPVYGIQFHPESVLTPLGKRILGNFLKIKA